MWEKKRTLYFPNPNLRKQEKMTEDYCKFLDLINAEHLERIFFLFLGSQFP